LRLAPTQGAERRLSRVRALLDSESRQVDDQVEAVVAMLLYDNKALGDIQALLVQRAERTGDPWSGHMGFPGGRIKPSDTSRKGAVEREVMEEVGVDIARVGDLLGSLPAAFPWNRPEMKVQPFVYVLKAKPEIILGPEIIHAFWIELSELPKHLTKSEVQTRTGPRQVESFLVDGRIVWGFTFRVLNEFLMIFGGPASVDTGDAR
ncbi:MAG TPA: CoA pyrophosphatase, partial [Candidatus Binatus sp.]|nr:CoA pyrophosphatase [Candidatus Binatus sp.]